MAFSIEEETIDDFFVSTETKKLWAVEMDLARHLLDVCAKYKLKIWAAGGTLLGAVRHKGFIPWDDDMDFCMMRDDFNKLVEIGPKEFKNPYFFQSFYTDNFWGGMIKIRRSDTAMIHSHFKLRDYNMGVFIDVFVIDAIPDDEEQFVSIYKKLKLLRKLLYNNNIIYPKSLSFSGRVKHSFVSFFFKLVSPLKVQNRIVNLLSRYSIAENKECGFVDFSALESLSIKKIFQRCNKHCYDETIYLPFHDLSLPAPKGYDEILTRQYGDYMTPVRGGQLHKNIYVNCDKPYKEVLLELRKNVK